MDDLLQRLTQYEGKSWETTVCYNGLRDAAATEIERLRAAIGNLLARINRDGGNSQTADIVADCLAAENVVVEYLAEIERLRAALVEIESVDLQFK